METVEVDNVEFSIGKYVFNTNTKTLISGKYQFKLTTKETQLMRLLVLNKNELLERSDALKTIWHENNHLNGRSMDVFITKLRKYLMHDQKVEIVNVHGKGFKLVINSYNKI